MTFITTCLVSLVALVIWQVNIVLVLAAFTVFGTFDGLYLSSSLTKVPSGAWFTLCLAVILSSVFVLWRYGKENQWRAEAADRIAPRHLLAKIDEGSPRDIDDSPRLCLQPTSLPITKLPGVGIFYDKGKFNINYISSRSDTSLLE